MGQPRQPPVGHRGYREGEIVTEFPTEVEESKKRAEGSDQCLQRRCPILAGPLQQKISNGLCVPLADILAERPEKICGTAGVLPESRLLQAAMRSEPVAKSDYQRRIGSQIRNRFGRANPSSNEMMMKELHSELGMIADLSALEMRASATAEVTAKRLKRCEIDVLQHTPSPLNEAAEMRRGSDVSNGA